MVADGDKADTATMTLDGRTVRFSDGETVFDVAQRHSKFVPTLCFDSRLEPFGSCRLCVVDVEGARTPLASCTTPATARDGRSHADGCDTETP